MEANEIQKLLEASDQHEFLIHDISPINPLGEWTPVPDGTIRACSTCGHYACVCAIRSTHDEGCPFRRSATCAIPIACDHGFDVCPECDPCTCAVAGVMHNGPL